MDTAWTEIRTPEDVTEEMVEEAAAMREGMYGNRVLSWGEIIDRLEYESDNDWGQDPDSPAIRELKRRVRKHLASY